jgi:hypothetical protein
MQARRVDLDAIVERCGELLARIHERNGQFEIDETLYNVVAFKLFGYAVNTFKSIYYLLPHTVYEQAAALHRTLWEIGVNLEWISRDPEARAGRFVQFTAAEYRSFIEKRIGIVRRAQDSEAVLRLTAQLGEFEHALEQQLCQFRYADRRGKERWRQRFSMSSLGDVAREVGGDWLEEYDRDYTLGCMYTHGAPGAVLFPLHDTRDHEIARARDIERSGITGAMAIEVMSRVYRRWLAARHLEDDEFLGDLSRRVRQAGSA